MSGIVYYVIDTETTGLSTNYHEITELGIIRCFDRMQLWRQVKCLYPERANFDALAITQKTLADLSNGDDPEQVILASEKFFNEDNLSPAHRCIVGHNISFDRKFLHALWERYGKEFPAHLWLDTMALTRQYLKDTGIEQEHKAKGLKKPSVNLHAACDWAGVKKLSASHNAKVDSRNTYLLYQNLVEEKKINYLPFIKTAVHKVNSFDSERADISDL